jgi:Co/Zn/Cd efflux system component
MLLQALHLITEDNIKIPPIKFLEWLSVLKVIINMIALFIFSDYILHPELQIKLYLWKFSKEWKPLNEVSIEKLKKCSNLLKKWNNHFENMNALTSSLISDLICSTLFIIFFYSFNEIYYSKGYFIISLTNFIIVIILVRDSFYSIMKILMQGKCTIYESFYSKLNQEISYFEGCQGVKEIKFWMNSQNNIKVYIKIYANKNLNRNQLKNRISEITKEIELICDYTLEIDE